jgi:hypothetical protein
MDLWFWSSKLEFMLYFASVTFCNLKSSFGRIGPRISLWFSSGGLIGSLIKPNAAWKKPSVSMARPSCVWLGAMLSPCALAKGLAGVVFWSFC